MHAGTRYVVAKAIQTRYYWPTMHADARKLIRERQDCQGIDIAETFPKGPNKVKFLIVAMDYFTKWIKAKPVATITVIPAEIGMPTLKIAELDMMHNDEALEINLDLLEEIMEQAAIREARSKAKMEKYYNSKGYNTSFKPGDLVYRNNNASHAKDSGKLSPK
uniref:Retrovirus-related Pol polyprotein from transposon 17.6 n=1 Tax=Tanacetum cinerariifolium TaxID=118510 RepID=A0A699JAB6_TANCI|nr:retrovirus-related Pol polyprotein from transposon 17.6 [Tanacetum cinerariifolium]